MTCLLHLSVRPKVVFFGGRSDSPQQEKPPPCSLIPRSFPTFKFPPSITGDICKEGAFGIVSAVESKCSPMLHWMNGTCHDARQASTRGLNCQSRVYSEYFNDRSAA